MTEEKAKSLIGRKVRTFKDSGFIPSMEKYVGEYGIIKKVTKWSGFTIQLNVLFEDGRRFNFYVDEDSIDLYLIEPYAPEIEQLKAENAELVEAVKNLYNLLYDAHYNCNNELTPFPTRSALDNTKQTLEKHGK